MKGTVNGRKAYHNAVPFLALTRGLDTLSFFTSPAGLGPEVATLVRGSQPGGAPRVWLTVPLAPSAKPLSGTVELLKGLGWSSEQGNAVWLLELP